MDDLTKLKGVGVATAAMLVAAGITSFVALATADLAQLTAAGDFKPGHDVAGWIEEAKALVAGTNDTERKPDPEQVWRGSPVSVVLKVDVDGVGVADEVVTLPDMDAADLRHAGKARRMLLSDLPGR